MVHALYDRYWACYQEEPPLLPGEEFYRYAACPGELEPVLAEMAKDAYCAVRGPGYGRVDIRQDKQTGEYFVLEVNANCGLSGDDQTTVGNILRIAGLPFPSLLGLIISETLNRWATQ